MLRQTRFLGAVYGAYEQRVAELSLTDEHVLREHLIRTPAANPVERVVVTVADWIAEPNGLYRADFDLLARLPRLEALDIVATEEILASGFHERVHDWLPGIEEVDHRAIGASIAVSPPVIVAPPGSTARPVFVSRDREEELVAIVRRVRGERGPSGCFDRTAIVFKRPLPYLYLAHDVFCAAHMPYHT